MNERWEKGIVVGISTECYYVASPNEEYFLRKNVANDNFKIGDCMNFTFGIIDSSNGRIHRGIVLKHEKCAQFVEWELLKTKNAAILKSDIIDITIENHPYSNKPVRCVRTKYLEKVYDSDVDTKTFGLTDSDLLGSKAVAVRITNAERKYFWALLGCERKLNMTGSLKNSLSDRNIIEGIVLNLPTKNSVDTIYVWVPGRRRSLVLSPSARGNQPREKFYGNWISFSISPSVGEIDINSDIRIIDDVLPTRFHSNQFEVRVNVSLEYEYDQRMRNIELKSRECGIVVDTSDTLERYDRLKTFSDRAWVYNFPYDLSRDIRFVLSEKQNEWEDNYNDNRFHKQDHDYHEMNAKPRSNFENSKINEDFRQDMGYYRNDLEKSRDSQRTNESEKLVTDSYEKSNYKYNNEKMEYSNEQRKNRPSSPKDNSDVDSWDREDDIESREGKNRNRKIDSDDYFNRGDGRESSRPHVRNENDREKSRYDKSLPRKRDDTNSIPSTSKSFEESTAIRSNLNKLKKKYDYLTENDMEVPQKLIEELKKATIEEQNSARIKNFNYDDFDENHSRISEIRKQRELAKIEIDEEELKKYKKLVSLFRDMMSSEKVCHEMRHFDERSMNNINRLIFEL